VLFLSVIVSAISGSMWLAAMFDRNPDRKSKVAAFVSVFRATPRWARRLVRVVRSRDYEDFDDQAGAGGPNH
jgi:hypothetical protein